MPELTQERLKELLHYDPATGVFTWRVSAGGVKAGSVAGSLYSNGYRLIGVKGKYYLAHRLAWLYTTGAWPLSGIDHRNGVCDDNRFCNLREASKSENQHNRKTPVNNTSGFLGVTWHTRDRKWQAQIMVGGSTLFLGSFLTPEDAHAAYLAAKAIHHPFQPAPRA